MVRRLHAWLTTRTIEQLGWRW